ncbi:MAG: toxin-antitoxin system HicB family antitoxin [Aggregatilineales bacterium]
MTKTLDEYIKQPYTRIFIPNEDGSYSAEIFEFPGCFADGQTPDEAMQNLEEAAKSWIEACLEQGLDIPEPFMNQDFGGRIALRLPRSLHRQASRMAMRDGVSLNQFLVSAIAAKVGAEDLFARLMDKFEHRVATSVQNITLIRSTSTSMHNTIRIESSKQPGLVAVAGTDGMLATTNGEQYA